MITRVVSMLFFVFMPNLAQAEDCRGKTMQCFDYCTGSYATVHNVNKCDMYYDYQQGCYKASGFCSDSSGGAGSNNDCRGKTEQCFDYCAGSNVTVHNVNTCDKYFDYQQGCYKATGYCK